MSVKNQMTCLLCQNMTTRNQQQIEDEGEFFCCKGCHVVYQILKAQHALEGFQSHPVYKQALKAGFITQPYSESSKLEEKNSASEDFKKLHLTIQNMWCPSCAQIIHLILMREKGITQCVVDYSTDLAVIEYSPRFISKEKIIRLIENLSYQPYFLQDPRQQTINRTLTLRFIIAAFFSLNVMMFAYPIYATYFNADDPDNYAQLFAYLSLIASIPVLSYSAWPIWQRGYRSLRLGIGGMESLVFIGVIAATGLSFYELWAGSPYVYFDTITVIIMFVLLGKIIESKAKFSAKDSLIKLSLALPRRGRKILENGEEQFVPIKEFGLKDCLVVKTGEKIVLDGIVEEGEGVCDESLMTGESIPIVKHKNSTVLAGTLLQQGYLKIKVTHLLEETALHRIIDMIGLEIDHKAHYVRAADQIIKWFVPFVVFLAFLTGSIVLVAGLTDGSQTVMQTAIIRAISVLLISCPCAIGIAVPIAEAYILNELAKIGIIVRNRGCLRFLGQETTFIFDKTGTLTEGVFTVCQGLEQLSFDQKRILKGLVHRSLHPISIALNQALLCPAHGLESIEEKIGRGMQGVFEKEKYYLGSLSFLNKQGVVLPDLFSYESPSILTTVFFAKEKTCLAVLMLGDNIREGAQEFIGSLSLMKTVLLSGDAEKVVSQVAQMCQIKSWQANCHPLDKKRMIDQLKEKNEVVAMLGDGINDAPALTAAHIGIAMVSASDISIQVSDLLLTTKSFQALSQLRQIAVLGKKIIRQNLFWAFFYNLIGLGLAMMGLLTPLFAAFAMIMSSLIVLLNAQRIGRLVKSSGKI